MTDMNPKKWIEFGESDAVPCPKCSGKDLEFNANVVSCTDCGYYGPAQEGPEFACDWRIAIREWNASAT